MLPAQVAEIESSGDASEMDAFHSVYAVRAGAMHWRPDIEFPPPCAV